jgi:hypothetical protein
MHRTYYKVLIRMKDGKYVPTFHLVELWKHSKLTALQRIEKVKELIQASNPKDYEWYTSLGCTYLICELRMSESRVHTHKF